MKRRCFGSAVPEGLFMASHKIAAMLRSTGQLSEEEIEDMSEDEAWEWLRSNAMVSDNAGDCTGGADDT